MAASYLDLMQGVGPAVSQAVEVVRGGTVGKLGPGSLGASEAEEGQPAFLDAVPAHQRPQAGVLSGLTSDALFLTIHLHEKADLTLCATLAAKAVSSLSEPAEENSGIASAVIGFSENLWSAVQPSVPAGIPTHPFQYNTRKNPTSSMPATGGDIFVHIKAHSRGACFTAAHEVLEALPKGSIYDAEDVHGFKFKDQRDLMGHKIHHAKPDPVDAQFRYAVIPTTGGTYALTQQWRHQLFEFEDLSLEEKDRVIGKKAADPGTYVQDAGAGYVDLEREPGRLADAVDNGLPETSHVSRVIGVDQYGQRIGIVRQSMPCGSLAPGPVTRDNIQEPGLYFLGFASDPLIFSYMLDRMMGASIRGDTSHPRPTDKLLEYSQCTRGQLYYVPGQQQLEALANLHL